jgi:Domain of unknown function (DUF6538)
LCTPVMGMNLWGESPLYENLKVFIVIMDTNKRMNYFQWYEPVIAGRTHFSTQTGGKSLKYLVNIDGIYYFRRRIPDSLVHTFGHRELKVSLRTSDKKTAKTLCSKYLYKFESAITLMKLRDDWKEVVDVAFNKTDEELKVEELRAQLVVAEAFLPRRKRLIPEDTIETPAEAPTNNSIKQNKRTHSSRGTLRLLFSQVADDFIKEKTSTESWTKQSKEEAQGFFNQFTEILGNRLIGDYTRDDFIHYMNVLKLLPKNYTKSSEFKGKKIEEISRMPHNLPLLNWKTVNLRIKRIKALFIYCRRQTYISQVPCEGLLLKQEFKG